MALAGLTAASCEDFLTLMPLNDIVLENFWTDKNDVEAVLLGSYAALEVNDCLVRMSLWGEMRSDNLTESSSNSNNDITQITRDNLLSTNSFSTYKCFYDVINRANTVLHFAPIVAEEDPNYSHRDLLANEAEAIGLRSLSYWYLIRAYKNVPYTAEPSIDDTHNFFIPASSFDSILNVLISDLESVEPNAVNRFGKREQAENTARITRSAINAMLADMYLWKGDYDKCIACCEKVTARKKAEWAELQEEQGTSCNVKDFNGYPLISEVPSGSTAGNAYQEIFGTGNSFETLFELPFDQQVNNSFVSSYYNSNTSSNGNLKATSEVGSNFSSGSNSVFKQKTDGRYYQCCNVNGTQTSNFGITKYVYQTLSYDLSSGSVGSTLKAERFNFNTVYPHWIIYRYTDVLLMQAEALVQKAKANPAQRDALLSEAFNIVDAVNRRANCFNNNSYLANGTPLKKSDYGTDSQMEELVLDERRRELMFEGKRWFDLVRKSMRDGNSEYLVSKVLKKQDAANQSAVRIKLDDLDALFFPLNKDELKINTMLKQNPVYIEDEFVAKAK